MDCGAGWDSIKGIWAVTRGGAVPLNVLSAPHWINTEISLLRRFPLCSCFRAKKNQATVTCSTLNPDNLFMLMWSLQPVISASQGCENSLRVTLHWHGRMLRERCNDKSSKVTSPFGITVTLALNDFMMIEVLSYFISNWGWAFFWMTQKSSYTFM